MLGDHEEQYVHRQQREEAGNSYVTEAAEKSLHRFVLPAVRVGVARFRSFDAHRRLTLPPRGSSADRWL
jgi:hypothetical protein